MLLDFEDLSLDKVTEIAKTLDEATRNGVQALQEHVPAEVIIELFNRATALMKREPTVLDLDFTESKDKVTVVGDTHGQYHDVLRIFEVAGTPSKSSTFILNGDFVDRGAWGLETLILFVCWKLIFPQNVYLIRGNHESQLLTELYGFKAEVQAKYHKAKSRSIYSSSKKLFSVLPLAAVLQKNTLILHGGLFRAVPKKTGRKRKKGVKKQEEKLQLGTLDYLRTCSKGGIEPSRMKVSLAISDALWSDPVVEEGLEENTSRGLGLTFGPDATNQFLKENKLKLIIRSHEGPDAREFREGMSDMMTGYSVDHETENGNLVTVFSAPDYPQFQDGNDRMNNSASVVVLTAPDYATPTTVSFKAVLPRPPATVFYDMELYVETDIDFNEIDPEVEKNEATEKNSVQKTESTSESERVPSGDADPITITESDHKE